MAVRPDPTSSEPPLVGFEADKRQIMNALLDTSEQRRSVVAIVGPRGVGKTYLAKEIYTSADVQKHFDVHIWLSAARNIFSNKDDALKEMREQLSIEDETDISNFLRDKRYCVVLDDLNWSSDRQRAARFAILEEIRDNNNRSRVLVTSRPEYGDCGGPIPILMQYEVVPRSNKQSLEILKAAFSKDPWEGCRPSGEVHDLVMKFVMKCEGLPWPLRFLGGVLSECPWNEILDRIEAMEVGGMSFVHFTMRYRDLPSYSIDFLGPPNGITRAAFLYLLTFPEDAEIHAETLVHLLELERIISSSEEGEHILRLLAKRSMIEVTKRYSVDHSIKCCRLHDPLLRLLAIHEAKEKRFVWTNFNDHPCIIDLFAARIFPSDVVKKTDKFGGKFMDVAQLTDASCILNFGENLALETALMSDRVQEIKGSDHLRTLAVRDTTIEFLPSNELQKMRSLEYLSLIYTRVREISIIPKSLKTLDIGGTPIETLPDAGSCPNLTSLLLRNTKVCEIPKSFKNLVYLDVRDTLIRSLPNSLWNNKILKSIRASDTFQHLDGPPSKADLDRLETLGTVHVSNKWGRKLPKFDGYRVKKLGLSNFQNAFTPYNALNWDVITGILRKLEVLYSLKIQGNNVPAIIIDERTCPSYVNLKKLWVGGSYSHFSLSGITMPQSLTTLTLENLEFDEDPMPNLGQLQCLESLRMRWLLYTAQIKKMICKYYKFPKLKRMQLYHISGLEEWSVEEGALPKITNVVIESCKALKDLSGPLVDPRTPLKELHLHAMPPGLTRKFSHLPFVKITEN